mmetsp:Transcript_37551/g.104423  ORF Transcript_37551/g.104423 Transcript_37551/m.104423 type:complete len:224 (+) Transcript_37551:225-896(+)
MQRPALPPMAAPMGMERPKVKTAGTTPTAAPRRPPETRPVAPPPAPSVTAPPKAEAAAACVLRSTTTSRTPSRSSETFVRLYSRVSAACACAEVTSERAANAADPATFWDRIRSSMNIVPLASEVCTTPSMPRTTSNKLSADDLRCEGAGSLQEPDCSQATSAPSCCTKCCVSGGCKGCGCGGLKGCTGGTAHSGEGASVETAGWTAFHLLPKSKRCMGVGNS